jgi:hypothetical protein
VASPQPNFSVEADAECGTFALSVDGTRVVAGTRWVYKEAEFYEQFRQRETLLTACEDGVHVDGTRRRDTKGASSF